MNMILILKNASYLLTSNMLVRSVTAVAAILVARYLGVEDYGMLSVGLAFSAVAAYFTDMGLTHTLMREGTKEKSDLTQLLGGFVKVRFLFALLTGVLSAVLIYGMYDDPDLRRVLYWMVLPTILGAAMQGVGMAYFQVTQQMKYKAYIGAVAGVLTAATLFLGMALEWPLLYLAPSYGLSSIVGGLLAIWMVTRRISILSGGWQPALLKGLGSFTLGGLVVMMMPQLGPLVLERVTDIAQVGYFAAAFRIPVVLYQIPGVLAAAFYPMLFRYGNEGKHEEHLQLGVLQLKFMNMMGMLMAVPFLFYAEWWVEVLYGDAYEAAAPLLAMLSLIVLLQSINFPLADSLTTKGMQFRRTMVLLVAGVTGVSLYAGLGHAYGAAGGAWSAIIVECILMLGFLLTNPTGWKLFWRGARWNLLSFAGVAALGFTLGQHVHAMIGAPVLGLLLAAAALGFDGELRRKLIGFVQAKRKKKDTGAKGAI